MPTTRCPTVRLLIPLRTIRRKTLTKPAMRIRLRTPATQIKIKVMVMWSTQSTTRTMTIWICLRLEFKTDKALRLSLRSCLAKRTAVCMNIKCPASKRMRCVSPRLTALGSTLKSSNSLMRAIAGVNGIQLRLCSIKLLARVCPRMPNCRNLNWQSWRNWRNWKRSSFIMRNGTLNGMNGFFCVQIRCVHVAAVHVAWTRRTRFGIVSRPTRLRANIVQWCRMRLDHRVIRSTALIIAMATRVWDNRSVVRLVRLAASDWSTWATLVL
mmetsp:Transcript_55430/g.92119  ORF Transcript_55430/g.92119 Transcript_55430/m.92119 type:complete len:268 (+) Transcript_55430:1258-2061(+)